MLKRFYILVLVFFLVGCGGGDSDSAAIAPISALFPELRAYTYSDEVFISGDMSGIGNGSIEVYNSTTDQKVTAQLLTQQECYEGGYAWLIFFIVYIDDFCLTDESFAAVVPVDMGINNLTAAVMDNRGIVLQTETYSIERRMPVLSGFKLKDAELDKPFDPATRSYYVRSCSTAETIWVDPQFDRMDWPYFFDGPNGLDVIIHINGNEFEIDWNILELSAQQLSSDIDIDIVVFPYGKDDMAESIGTHYSLLLLNSSDKELLDINLSAGILDNIFDPLESEYHATVGYVDSSISVSATPTDMCAHLTINSLLVEHNAFSDPISLGEGLNLITIDVFNNNETLENRLMVYRVSDAEYLQSDYIKLDYIHDGYEYTGRRIATSGDDIVIEALDYHSPYRRAVYVATLTNEGGWSIQRLLSDSGSRTLYDVEITGNTIVVGVTNSNTDAVYIYERSQDGLWNNAQQIPSPEYDQVGYSAKSIAISGNTLVTSRSAEPSIDVVDIYTKDLDSGEWMFDTSINDLFTATGSQVYDIVLHESTLAILVNKTTNILNDYTVYILNRDVSGIWNLVSTLSMPARTIALYGNTLVGGSGDVYTKDTTGNWQHTTTLRASNHNDDDEFGDSIAIWEDTIAIGAHGEDSRATGVNNSNQGDNLGVFSKSGANSGATYIFKRDQSMSWEQTEYIKASNTNTTDLFGYAISLSDAMLVVGAPGESSCDTSINGNQADNSCYRRGAVYIYR
ncbi:MAG: cadherin-like beta sandwich domain-containing protein [Thiotrichales bacterium]|nr:MAG: cadherin-like beta sandwich domain-containing protein [Thiotrichales bacterium]